MSNIKTFLMRNWWLIGGFVLIGVFLILSRQEGQALAAYTPTLSIAGEIVPAANLVEAAPPSSSSPAVPTIVTTGLTWFFAVLLIGLVGCICIWVVSAGFVFWRNRQMRFVTDAASQPAYATSVKIVTPPARSTLPAPRPEADSSSTPVAASRKPSAVTTIIDQVPSDPRPSPSVTRPEPWAVWPLERCVKLQAALGWDMPTWTLIPDLDARERRIRYLAVALNAPVTRVAADASLVIFPGLALPIERLCKVAAPQPAQLTVDTDGQLLAVIGLFHAATVAADVAQAISDSAPHIAERPSEQPQPIALPADPWLSIAHPIRISDSLPLSLQQFESEVVIIAGKRRSGKSYTEGVVLEELCQRGAAFAAIDLEGEMYGLRAHYPVVIVGKSTTTVVDMEVAPQHADRLARWAHQTGQQVILDLSAYKEDDQIAFAQAFAEGLWTAATTAEPRRTFILVADEAHELLPQQGKTAASDPLRRLTLRGGKWGIGLVFTSQRPAELSKVVFTQAGIALLHMAEQALDLKAYASALPYDWTEARITETMQRLQVGMCIAKVSRGNAPTTVDVIKVRARQTPHMGYTPSAHQSPPPRPGRVPLPTSVLDQLHRMLEDDQRDLLLTQLLDQTPPVQMPRRPYALLEECRKQGTKQRELVTHPVVIAAVQQAAATLGTGASAKKITARVFESAPGVEDGWTGARQTEIVQPILDGLAPAPSAPESHGGNEPSLSTPSQPQNLAKAA